MNKPTSAQKPPNILMVDDTPANLALLSDMLKGRGYTVRAAVSGKLALLAARSTPPDLILLDINMPGMDGYEVCRHLKEDEQLKEIPVVFLSALSETLDIVKAFTAGGVDYITKPFQLAEVEARVDTHLELRSQKRRLQEALDELREAETLRDSLVHMIVHDLRSPLTGIYAYLELIKETAPGVLTARLRGYIDDALKSARQMVGIVSDILDTSRLEAGQLKPALEYFELEGAVDESIAGLAALSGTRKIDFVRSERPAIVKADKGLVLRVIQNLLANALKFTPDGGLISVGVTGSGGSLRLSFSDNGPGIAPEYREMIFKKFAQVELPAGRQKYSTGLGLAFCKLAVEAHGGRIGVDSAEGKGSTFWFELPAPPAGTPG